MRFERESWRKLYVAESMQHRALSLFSRGLRDYLIRFAEADGTLLHSTSDITSDLARVLGAIGTERRQLAIAIDQLVAIGYLTFSEKRLWITRFEEAQAAQSPGAKRQAAYAARRKADTAKTVIADVSNDAASVSDPVTNDVTPDETRRDETKKASASANIVTLTWCPTEATLLNLEMAGVPRWAELVIRRRFIGHHAPAGEVAPPATWEQRYSRWVMRDWGDPEKKPKREQADSEVHVWRD